MSVAAAVTNAEVLPSVAITIGPLLLWLDHRAGILFLATAAAGFHDLSVTRLEQ